MSIETQIAPKAPAKLGDRTNADHGVVLFDGVCNLCNGWVRFVIDRDRAGVFRFAPLQSDFARLELTGHHQEPLVDSIVLLESGKVFVRSTAVIRVLRRLTFPWPLFAVFLIVPRIVRDFLYDGIAKRRYSWFGRRAECMIPTPEIADRFLS